MTVETQLSLIGLLQHLGGKVDSKMRGPRHERTELLFFQASKDTGLHNVHPTWAGTFVLAALGAVFPGVHFILLDSDCLPVTLFEAADLWKEAYLTRFPKGSKSGLASPA